MQLVQVGDAVGVAHSTIKNWERGRGEPRGSQLSALARVLGVSVSWILEGDAASGGGAPDLPTMRDRNPPPLWDELVAA